MNSTAQKVREWVEQQPKGRLFRITDVAQALSANASTHETKNAIAKALRSLAQNQQLHKLPAPPGSYYKPKSSRFGTLPPSPKQIIELLTTDGSGQTTGYVTGLQVFNELGLTNQVPAVIQISSRSERSPVNVGGIPVRFTRNRKRTIPTTRENVPLLQLLDALEASETLPDATPERTQRHMLRALSKLSGTGRRQLRQLAEAYNTYTQALLEELEQQLAPRD